MGSILLKNGTVIDYASNTNEKLYIKVENRKNHKDWKNYKWYGR